MSFLIHLGFREFKTTSLRKSSESIPSLSFLVYTTTIASLCIISSNQKNIIRFQERSFKQSYDHLVERTFDINLRSRKLESENDNCEQAKEAEQWKFENSNLSFKKEEEGNKKGTSI